MQPFDFRQATFDIEQEGKRIREIGDRMIADLAAFDDDAVDELVKALSDALSLLRCYRNNCSSDLDEDEVIASCEAALALAEKESK